MNRKAILIGAILALIAVALGAFTSFQNQYSQSNVRFVTLKSQVIPLSSLEGKWIFINYWASWCKPCHEEIPVLNQLATNYPHKVLVFGVSYDRVPLAELPKIVKRMQIQFITLRQDPAKELGIQAIPGLPVTYVINPNGKLVKRLLGVQTAASLIKIIA